MRFALLILLALAPDQRALQLYERMEFQPATALSDAARRVVEILEKKDHWVGAYSFLAEKFGPFPEDLIVTVDFEHGGEEMAQAGVRKRRSTISFNLARLAEALQSHDDFLARKKAAEARGDRLVLKIPAVKVERVIYHELTHVLQQGLQAPLWFIEGMAQLAGDDPNSICGFVYEKKVLKDIDGALAGPREVYARGHLFWKWLESRGAAQRVVDLTVFRRRPWKESLIEATQLSWETILVSEKEWSEKELEKHR